MRTDPNAETKPLPSGTQATVPVDGKSARPGIFLDRDGTLLQSSTEGKYINSRAEARFIPGALEALRELAKLDAWIFVVTNQAGIASGHLTASDLNEIHEWLVDQVQSVGGRIDHIYVCPHAQDAGCHCRKPAPGMILETASVWGVDLSRSVMVGDYVTDFEAAYNAGVAWYFHVETGRQSGANLGIDWWALEKPNPIVKRAGGLLDAAPVIGKIVERDRAS